MTWAAYKNKLRHLASELPPGDMDDWPEPYSPQGDRCPMCKNHRLIYLEPENPQSPIMCPECGWAGERFGGFPDDMSGTHEAARLSGMDDPTPDPQFDAERAAMPEQHKQDQETLVNAIRSIEPQMREFMRARGINEPDWGPLEAVIPPSHLGDWMWMGYGKNGQREYKHWATRRYLNLLPREELPPGYEGPGMDHLLKRRHIPFMSFYTRDGRTVHQPVDMNYALGHAYEDVDKLYGRNGEFGTHPYPQGYPTTEWEEMSVPPWQRPPYSKTEPEATDIDPYAEDR